jgi:hypothetical protein
MRVSCKQATGQESSGDGFAQFLISSDGWLRMPGMPCDPFDARPQPRAAGRAAKEIMNSLSSLVGNAGLEPMTR